MGVREQFVDEILSWANTPFVTEGCTKGPKGGTNCAKFFLDAILKTIPDGGLVAEGLNWSHIQFVKERQDIIFELLSKITFEISFKDILPGDVVLFTFRGISQIPAVYVGNDFFVYCNYNANKIVKEYLPSNLKKRIIHVCRFNCMR